MDSYPFSAPQKHPEPKTILSRCEVRILSSLFKKSEKEISGIKK